MSDCINPDPYDSNYTEQGYDQGYDQSTSVSFDSDGDGFAETTLIDFDGDGMADAFVAVDAETGAQHMGIDIDGDGRFDTMISDFDGDGEIDLVTQDTDGDGQLDTELDPETGEPIGEPFIVDPTGSDPTDPTLSPDDDSVHGEPMAEIEYHQAQVGPNDCLPTSVAMVLTEITGTEVPQGDIVDLANELGLLGPTGMTLEGGLQLLDHYGVEAEVQTGSMDDLRTMLDEGTEVIIGLDADDLYGQGDAPFADDLVSGHAVVITGIDDEAGLVYINDPGFPDGAGVAISIEAFEDAWQDADNSMIVVEGDAVDAGAAGNADAAPFAAAADDDNDGILATITRLVLMPFNLKVG